MNDLAAFFPEGYTILLFIKLILGAAAAFIAVMAWRKTREPYMIMFILGILASYVTVLHQLLRYFGFVSEKDIILDGIAISIFISENIPIILFIASLCLFLKSKKI